MTDDAPGFRDYRHRLKVADYQLSIDKLGEVRATARPTSGVPGLRDRLTDRSSLPKHFFDPAIPTTTARGLSAGSLGKKVLQMLEVGPDDSRDNVSGDFQQGQKALEQQRERTNPGKKDPAGTYKLMIPELHW